uniref:DUF5641 domain-containing protein n=1 Tax=Anopheles funestus TaxID=62324 RepID=A0A182R8W1_ANOFN
VCASVVPIESDEYKRAEMLLFQMVQEEWYQRELDALKKGDKSKEAAYPEVRRTSPLYNLDPFLDELGVIRMDDRTAKAANIPFDARFPIILPAQHHITTLMLKDYHDRYGHAKRKTVVNEVRQRFYIPILRSAVDKVTKACQRCKIRKLESLINSPPLTYMPHTSSEQEALTPNHFLLGSSAGRKEKLRATPKPVVALRSSYQQAVVLAEAMWERWLKEYVPTLNKRTKWVARCEQLKVGDLVFITEGPRKEWPRAIVEEIFPGSDATGKILKRPTEKLAMINAELDSEQQTHNTTAK